MVAKGGPWSHKVDKVVMTYRNLPHDVMKVTPNQLLFGSSLRLFGLPPLANRIDTPFSNSFPSTLLLLEEY